VPNSSGIEVLEAETFRLQCFQTHTCVPSRIQPRSPIPISTVTNSSGTKFLLITEPRQPNVDVVLRRIYELYADYVMKNPFYQLEMPIRCEEFDRNLGAYAKSIP
jgi:trafficking protein particle complex subunit 4